MRQEKSRPRIAPATGALLLTVALTLSTGCSGSSKVTGTSGSTTDTTSTSGSSGAYSQSGGTVTKTGQAYTASATDQSGVYVTAGGTLTLTHSTVRTTGNTSSPDNSSFYGQDAGVLASAAGKIEMSDCSVTTTGTGANGVFATGSGSSIVLAGDTITCSGQLGHGVDATQGATMTLTDVVISTGPGANSAAIATDRGGGTITVTGGRMTTSGADAPGIYSTGAISVTGATISASGSEAAVIEGANSITLTRTALSGSLKRGVMIYQSMSGDASGTQGTFTMTGGSLSAAAGPLFYVTNSTGIIRLTGVALSASSGVLVNAAAGSWGTSGSNGGTARLTATGQTLVGSLVSDGYSSISATLQSGSSLTGAVNSAALSLDATSAWYVTANSALTTLSDADGISGTAISNVHGNGHTVTYDSSLSGNSALGGRTYTLEGGGTLTPK